MSFVNIVILRIKQTITALRIIRNPGVIDDVKSLTGEMIKAGDLDGIVPFYRKNETTAKALKARATLGEVTMGELNACSEGTLGKELYLMLTEQGLDIGELQYKTEDGDLGYTMTHLYESHDVWHLVTGFKTDVAGEIGLQGFYFAQNQASSLSASLIVLALLNGILFEPTDMQRRRPSTHSDTKWNGFSAVLFGGLQLCQV